MRDHREVFGGFPFRLHPALRHFLLHFSADGNLLQFESFDLLVDNRGGETRCAEHRKRALVQADHEQTVGSQNIPNQFLD